MEKLSAVDSAIASATLLQAIALLVMGLMRAITLLYSQKP
jgi:hypothetical protein